MVETLKLLLLFFVLLASLLLFPAEGVAGCVNGDVQLAGGPNDFEGRVEYCAGGNWAQVCGNGAWGRVPGNVVCNHTANYQRTGTVIYLGAVVTSGYYSAEELPMSFVNISTRVRCKPRAMFNSCVGEPHDQGSGCGNSFASAACPANCTRQSVRLATNLESHIRSESEGLVEICYDGTDFDTFWAGVCFNNLSLTTATVVCRELRLLQENTTVNISESPARHRYAYSSIECIGNESHIRDCVLGRVQREANCSAAVVTCQENAATDTTTTSGESPTIVTSTNGGPDPTSTGHTASGQDTTTSEAKVTSTDEGPDPRSTGPMASGQDMLAIITGAVCGFVILLLLIVVLLLIFVLLTRNRTRLKIASPTTTEGGSQPSLTTDSGLSGQTGQQQLFENGSESLKRLTIDNTNYHTTQHAPTGSPAVPTDNVWYSQLNNPQMQSGVLTPGCPFPIPETTSDGLHVYDEPSDATKDSGYHEYAELVNNQANRRLPLPLPYERPQLASGGEIGYVNQTQRDAAIPSGHVRQCANSSRLCRSQSPEYHEYAELTDVNATRDRPE